MNDRYEYLCTQDYLLIYIHCIMMFGLFCLHITCHKYKVYAGIVYYAPPSKISLTSFYD